MPLNLFSRFGLITGTLFFFSLLVAISNIQSIKASEPTYQFWQDSAFLSFWNLQDHYVIAALRRYEQQVQAPMTAEQAEKAIWIEKYAVAATTDYYSTKIGLCQNCPKAILTTFLRAAIHYDVHDQDRVSHWTGRSMSNFITDVTAFRKQILEASSGKKYASIFNNPDRDPYYQEHYGLSFYPEAATHYPDIYDIEAFQHIKELTLNVLIPMKNSCRNNQPTKTPLTTVTSLGSIQLSIMKTVPGISRLQTNPESHPRFARFNELARMMLDESTASCDTLKEAYEEFSSLRGSLYDDTKPHLRARYLRFLQLQDKGHFATDVLSTLPTDFIKTETWRHITL